MRLVVIILLLIGNLNIKEDAERILKDYFGSQIKTEMIKYSLPDSIRINIEKECRQKFFKNYVYVWKIIENKKK